MTYHSRMQKKFDAWMAVPGNVDLFQKFMNSPLPIPTPTDQKAYHEAGHAVVAKALGINVIYVSNCPTNDSGTSGAFTVTDLAKSKAPRIELLKQDTVLAFGGPIAQAKQFPNSNWQVPGEADDYHGAEQNLFKIAKMSGADFEELYDKLHKYAEKLVDDNWAAIKAVAKKLNTHKQVILRQRKFEAIVNGLIADENVAG